MNILDYIIVNFSNLELSIYRTRVLEKLTLEETGKKYGITRERVRQIEVKARKKVEIYKLDVKIKPII